MKNVCTLHRASLLVQRLSVVQKCGGTVFSIGAAIEERIRVGRLEHAATSS